MPMLLKVTAGGLPINWVDWRRAVCLYIDDKVLWEAGAERILIRGGTNRASGQRSSIALSPIIAVNDQSQVWEQGGTLALSRRRLYARDHGLCLYCGHKLGESTMTIDHVQPRSRGGEHCWLNVVTSCRHCNQRKGCRTPDEADMQLLAVPYAPNIAELLALSGRNVLADQMDYLDKFVSNSLQ